MITLQHKDLLNAGVHLGHLSKKWHPNMASFIFMERHGIHIIDLNKTLTQLQEATNALQNLARAGKKILFVATKKQAKDLVEQEAKRLEMPYMTERWLGGTLTNFITIRRLIKKLSSMDRMAKSDTYKNMAKKEQLMLARDKAKLERVLKGILDLTKPPGALVVVDITKEHIAVQEATKLGIPIIALTDTNSDPNLVDYPIPSNDDANPSIALLINAIGHSIEEGLHMRAQDKELEAADKELAMSKPMGKPMRARKAEKVASTGTAISKQPTGGTAQSAQATKKPSTSKLKSSINQDQQALKQEPSIAEKNDMLAKSALTTEKVRNNQSANKADTISQSKEATGQVAEEAVNPSIDLATDKTK